MLDASTYYSLKYEMVAKCSYKWRKESKSYNKMVITEGGREIRLLDRKSGKMEIDMVVIY